MQVDKIRMLGLHRTPFQDSSRSQLIKEQKRISHDLRHGECFFSSVVSFRLGARTPDIRIPQGVDGSKQLVHTTTPHYVVDLGRLHWTYRAWLKFLGSAHGFVKKRARNLELTGFSSYSTHFYCVYRRQCLQSLAPARDRRSVSGIALFSPPLVLTLATVPTILRY